MQKLLLIILMLSLLGCSKDPKVTKNTNLYELPDKDSRIIEEIVKNADVDLYFKIYNWCRISYNGKDGYTPCDTLEILPLPQGALSGKTVIVDAGHGGKDHGAMVNNINEKDINRSVSDYLIRDLKEAGANVIETRIDDETLPIYNRPTITNLAVLVQGYLKTTNKEERERIGELIIELDTYLMSKNNRIYDIYNKDTSEQMTSALQTIFELTNNIDDMVFVTIHSNVTGSPTVNLQGLDIILTGNNVSTKYPGYDKFNEDERKLFGDLLGKHISIDTGMNLRRTYFGDYAVLREENLPSALIELGYMDNPDDLAFMLNKKNQENYALGITNAIIEFFAKEK